MLALQETGRFQVFDFHPQGKESSKSEITNERARDLYNECLRDVTLEAAQSASIQDRKRIGIDPCEGIPNSFTYGEITEIDSFVGIISAVRALGVVGNEGWSDAGVTRKFYDLGSGSGRCVIAAALLGERDCLFHECIGIELLPSLHGLSLLVDCNYGSITRREGLHIKTKMLKEDLLTGTDWTDGFVVFANSTCFDNELFYAMAERARGMRAGSVFVTNSSPLPPSAGFAEAQDIRLACSWGHADVYLQVKL